MTTILAGDDGPETLQGRAILCDAADTHARPMQELSTLGVLQRAHSMRVVASQTRTRARCRSLAL